MMIATVTTPPATMPVSYESMTAHCRVDTDDERQLLLDYIASATAYAEQLLGMSLVRRTITAQFETGEQLHLPHGPVLQITSVTDANGNAVTFWHRRVGNSDRVVTTHGGPLTVVYQAGYTTMPADIVAAVRVHAATLYAWREDKSAAAANAVYKLDDFYRGRSFHPSVA